jgi:hypothetical protein
MYDADLEAYISERNPIIKTKVVIIGICFGILIGSMILVTVMVSLIAGSAVGWADVGRPDAVFLDDLPFGLGDVVLNYDIGTVIRGSPPRTRLVLRILVTSALIGMFVGIAYLPYRTRENIINDFKGISYLSTAQIFAIVIGSSPLFFLMVNTLYQHAIQL